MKDGRQINIIPANGLDTQGKQMVYADVLQGSFSGSFSGSSSGSFVGIFSGVFSGTIRGITTASSSSTGEVGEYVSKNVIRGAGVTTASSIAITVLSVSLTAGDWDVNSIVSIENGYTVNTWYNTCISFLTNSMVSTNAIGDYFTENVLAASTITTIATAAIPQCRIYLTASQTVYLNVRTNQITTAYGRISARRMR